MNIKPTSSKMNATIQPKNPPQRIQRSTNQSTLKPLFPISDVPEVQSSPPQQTKAPTKASPQPLIQQQLQPKQQIQQLSPHLKHQPKQHPHQILRQQPQQILQQTIKPTHATKQAQQTSNHRYTPPVAIKQSPTQQQPEQRHQDQPTGQPIKRSSDKFSVEKQAVVTFADHIPISDEELSQYKFGFFEEQQNQMPSRPIDNTRIANTNTREQVSKQSLHDDNKQKVKQSKASPITGETQNTAKRDVNSFNYEQILKFISDSKYSSMSFCFLESSFDVH